jgi:hypothetical protein
MQKFNVPAHSIVTYWKNDNNSYYSKKELEAVKPIIHRTPNEVRIAPAKVLRISINASDLILSKERIGNKYLFLTGLHSTDYTTWFVGNDLDDRTNSRSIVIFHFTDEKRKLTFYYFHEVDRHNAAQRIAFANTVIPHLRSFN